MTFKDYLALRRKSQHTITNYVSDADAYLSWKKAKANKESHLEALKSYVNYLSLERQLSASTINRNMSALKAYFSYLIYTNRLTQNPVDVVKLQIGTLEIPKRSPEFVTAEELQHILSSLHGKQAKRNKAIIGIMSIGGLRVSEVVNLNIGDIHDDHIKIIGKGNKERHVPLNDTLQRLLKDYLSERKHIENAAVFLSDRAQKRLTTRGIGAIIQSISKELGIKLHPHMFRHTAGTYAYAASKDIVGVQELLGHTKIETTRIYTHMLQENTRKVVEDNPLNTLFS